MTKKRLPNFSNARFAISLATAIASFFSTSLVSATPQANFPFNEGSGTTTTDAVHGFVGVFGIGDDPLSYPVWTNDSPAGATGDFSLAFNLTNPPVRQRINVDFSEAPFDF